MKLQAHIVGIVLKSAEMYKSREQQLAEKHKTEVLRLQKQLTNLDGLAAILGAFSHIDFSIILCRSV